MSDNESLRKFLEDMEMGFISADRGEIVCEVVQEGGQLTLKRWNSEGSPLGELEKVSLDEAVNLAEGGEE